MSLYEQAAAHKAKAEGMLGGKFGILADAIEDVRSSGLANRAKAVGTSRRTFRMDDEIVVSNFNQSNQIRDPIWMSLM